MSEDVLEEQEVDVPGGTNYFIVKLKKKYSIEQINLDEDYDYQDAECTRKRNLEYPPIEDIVIALLEKDNDLLNELKALRQGVKDKHPRPVKP